MANAIKLLAGPAYIAATATDIFNASSALIYSLVNHIRVVNHTSATATFTLYLGASGGSSGGTEISPESYSVPANDFKDLYFSPGLKMTSSQFLSGVCQTGASKLVITVMGQQGVV